MFPDIRSRLNIKRAREKEKELVRNEGTMKDEVVKLSCLYMFVVRE